jgi:hypothetical protein
LTLHVLNGIWRVFCLLLRLFNVAIAVIETHSVADTRTHSVALWVSGSIAQALITAPAESGGEPATADAANTRA